MLDHVSRKYFKLSVGKLKKDTPEELVCCCPLCGDKRNRLHLYNTEVGDLVHCFNEGCQLSDKHHSMKNFLEIINSSYLESYKRETLSTRISELKQDQETQGDQGLNDILGKIKQQEQLTEPEPIQNPKLPLDNLFQKASEVPEARDYLSSRKIEVKNDWFFSKNKFFEYKNKKYFLENYIIIPIYDKNKKYIGFYSRSIKEKTFSTFLLDNAEKIWLSNPDQSPEIICEGIFDALSTGFNNCGAMLSASISESYKKTLSKDVIIALDNDKTGIEKSKKFIQEGFKVFIWPDDIEEKDFNKMLENGYTKEEIKNLILNNNYQGFMAKTRIGLKEK